MKRQGSRDLQRGHLESLNTKIHIAKRKNYLRPESHFPMVAKHLSYKWKTSRTCGR